MHIVQYHPCYLTHQSSKPSLTMRTASNKPLTGPAPPVSRVRTRTGVGRGNKPTWAEESKVNCEGLDWIIGWIDQWCMYMHCVSCTMILFINLPTSYVCMYMYMFDVCYSKNMYLIVSLTSPFWLSKTVSLCVAGFRLLFSGGSPETLVKGRSSMVVLACPPQEANYHQTLHSMPWLCRSLKRRKTDPKKKTYQDWLCPMLRFFCCPNIEL